MSFDQREAQGLSYREAVERLGLDKSSLVTLIEAGFIQETPDGLDEFGIDALNALRSGETRAASNVTELVIEIEQHVPELARLTYERFSRSLPEAQSWTDEQKALFIEQANSRFAAILEVMKQGAKLDTELRRDLESVGAGAAWQGASLPHLLLVVRITRDLLLQSALRLTARAATSVVGAFGARMLPAIDRLTDALVQGYWSARLDQQQEEWHRLASVVEGSSYGVYEIDLDGVVRYANSAMSAATGIAVIDIVGKPLAETLKIAEPDALIALISLPKEDAVQVQATAESVSGPVPVLVDAVARRVDGKPVGIGGIVNFLSADERLTKVTTHDLGANRDFESFASPVESFVQSVAVDTSAMAEDIAELRRSVDLLAQAGEFIDRYAESLTHDRLHQAGKSIHRQSLRLDSILGQLDETRQNL